jgi:hypothetical protein
LEEQVDVVGDAADDQRLAAEVVGRAAEDVEQFVPPRVGEEGVAVLRGEDDVEVDLGQGLRRGRASWESGSGSRIRGLRPKA